MYVPMKSWRAQHADAARRDARDKALAARGPAAVFAEIERLAALIVDDDRCSYERASHIERLAWHLPRDQREAARALAADVERRRREWLEARRALDGRSWLEGE